MSVTLLYLSPNTTLVQLLTVPGWRRSRGGAAAAGRSCCRCWGEAAAPPGDTVEVLLGSADAASEVSDGGDLARSASPSCPTRFVEVLIDA